MANNTSPHILSTAANLLGFCLFVITSIHLTGKQAENLVDEFTSIVGLFLTVSSILSFLSIRTQRPTVETRLERWADYFFLASLIGILFIIGYITLHFVK